MNIDSFSEIVILYLKYKKITTNEYYPYSWYKAQIKFITNLNTEDMIRFVFNKLIKKNKILLVKHFNSTFYIFNPYEIDIKFNRFQTFKIHKQKIRIRF